MTSYKLRLSRAAEEDLIRLYAFLLEQDPASALAAEEAIERGFALLRINPFICRRAAGAAVRIRELVIGFGRAGYLALVEIDADTVTVLAVRHQREDDYH